ncbi:aminotransferase class V-fold PLP-dependent enzyme [Deinococcus sp. SL84]|uniref:aminotransferase class V-fold PLP-dependent enzyme n=1 Tax=Deinococcus sp. SL84 TaxID=2994663 RepID=UPI002276BCA9|nr:aminotransferase class V-fold PLP-dependent enzyme [Deinococcus sp. SL84]MCY1702792.1 aminotransferase class V-fold PLP-dependent enzyme [Deinococcus sp. SL84]
MTDPAAPTPSAPQHSAPQQSAVQHPAPAPSHPCPDPGGLQEFSVVYTDRALNHMSQAFQGVMRDLSADLKAVYGADAVAVIPGSGTSGMEAVVAQLAQDARCLVIRSGWFSYRWTQIFERSRLPAAVTVLQARPQVAQGVQRPYAPVPIEKAVETIRRERPALVFAPHVETSAGLILPDSYIRALAGAAHEVGGLLVIDAIASGCVWLDMRELGIDILISAPQKGWSSTPCAGLVMLSGAARARVEATESVSFSLDLKKWLSIMGAYEAGGHAYHATMPTDGLRQLRGTVREMREFGLDQAQAAQWELGRQVRQLLEEAGFPSVAAPGFQAPGVVVCYTDREDIRTGRAFAQAGLQIAAGVPLQCGEGEDFSTFRTGLFGLDKLRDVPGTVARFRQGLSQVLAAR